MKKHSKTDTPADLANLAKQAPETLSDLVAKSLSSARRPRKAANPARVIALNIDTRERLNHVVRRLVADCIRFYADDQDILDKMSTEALEVAVLEYLSKRDWYNRGLIDNLETRR